MAHLYSVFHTIVESGILSGSDKHLWRTSPEHHSGIEGYLITVVVLKQAAAISESEVWTEIVHFHLGYHHIVFVGLYIAWFARVLVFAQLHLHPAVALKLVV